MNASTFSRSPKAPALTVTILICLLSQQVPVASQDRTSPPQVDVFQSGKEGYHTFRIPVLLVTPKGTLLAFCEGRKTSRADHGDVDLVLKRSTDRGRTWGPLELVYEEGDTATITIGNPCPVVDRDTGIIWLPFCRDNVDVFMTHSRDDGKTWTKPVKITADVKKPDWSWYATGPGVGIQLQIGPHKGRLVMPCDHKNKLKDNAGYHSHVIYSDNHGKTWHLGGIAGSFTNECQVVELADGSLLLNMRNYQGQGGGDKAKSKRRAIAHSRAGGVTWGDLEFDGTLVEPICQASLHRYEGPGKSRLLFSNPASPDQRRLMTVRLSDDGGKTWRANKRIYKGSAAYSCLATLPDQKIGLLYERDDYRKITFTAFTVDWLTGGADH